MWKKRIDPALIQQLEKDKKKWIRDSKDLTLSDSTRIIDSWPALESYPLKKLKVLYIYLLDQIKLYPEKKIKDFWLIQNIIHLNFELPFKVHSHELRVLNHYGFNNEYGIGRLYGATNTMQGMSKETRAYLFKDTFVDLDLQSSSASILLKYAKLKGLEVNYLDSYVSNKAQFLQKVGGDEEEVKKKIIILTFHPSIKKQSIKQLEGLRKEFMAIRKNLLAEHIRRRTLLFHYSIQSIIKKKIRLNPKDKTPIPELIKGIKTQELMVTLKALYCATEESKVINEMKKLFVEQFSLSEEINSLSEKNTWSFIPFFDGALIRISSPSIKKEELLKFLSEVNTKIHPLRMVQKPFLENSDTLDLETLDKYYKIHTLLQKLTLKKYLKLLKLLGISEFRFNYSNVSKISATFVKSMLKAENKRATPKNKIEKYAQFDEFFASFENSDIRETINKSCFNWTHNLRQELLKVLDDEVKWHILLQDVGFSSLDIALLFTD